MTLPIQLKEPLKSSYSSCPAQWNGWTHDDRAVYVRFRWGVLAVYVAHESHKEVEYLISECVWKAQVSDDLDGTMDDEQMLAHLIGKVLTL